MNEQILNEALNLKSKLDSLKQHREQQAFQVKNKVVSFDIVTVDASSRRLLVDCLPIDPETMRTLYLMKLDAKIADLETQFENLKTP